MNKHARGERRGLSPLRPPLASSVCSVCVHKYHARIYSFATPETPYGFGCPAKYTEVGHAWGKDENQD